MSSKRRAKKKIKKPEKPMVEEEYEDSDDGIIIRQNVNKKKKENSKEKNNQKENQNKKKNQDDDENRNEKEYQSEEENINDDEIEANPLNPELQQILIIKIEEKKEKGKIPTTTISWKSDDIPFPNKNLQQIKFELMNRFYKCTINNTSIILSGIISEEVKEYLVSNYNLEEDQIELSYIKNKINIDFPRIFKVIISKNKDERYSLVQIDEKSCIFSSFIEFIDDFYSTITEKFDVKPQFKKTNGKLVYQIDKIDISDELLNYFVKVWCVDPSQVEIEDDSQDETIYKYPERLINFKDETKSNNFLDAQIRFIIKDEVVECSKILFCMQSRYNVLSNDIFIPYQHATVESVHIFVNWIESRIKTLDKYDQKMYLVLAKLADMFMVDKLADKIYKSLRKENKELNKKLNDWDSNYKFTQLNEESKKDIIDNLDPFLGYEKRNCYQTLSILRNLNYNDKVEILTRAIKSGKRPSLLSSISIFTDAELSSNNFSLDLAPLFQLSHAGLLFYLSSLRESLKRPKESNSSSSSSVKNLDSESKEQVRENKFLNDVKKCKDELTKLKSDSDELFKNVDKLIKQSATVTDSLNYLKVQLKSIEGEIKEQSTKVDDISKDWNEKYKGKYEYINKKSEESEDTKNSINTYLESYRNKINIMKSNKLENYIFCKIFLNNLSYQYVDNYISPKIVLNGLSSRYVNDSIFLISTTDSIQNEKESVSSKSFSFKKNSNSITCKFIDEIIFSPIYYELGFCRQPSDYSWEFLAKFKTFNYVDFDINSENMNQNLENENQNSENMNQKNDNGTNGEWCIIDEKDDDISNSEWNVIDIHHFDEQLPKPDDSYDPSWDDPFILKFKFLPGFFPSSIKLRLNLNKAKNQEALENCFNHFKIVGIKEPIVKIKEQKKNADKE